MADDIDIEEHDVMDNPAIKAMFPDLSVVKKEFVGFDVEVSPAKSIKKPCMSSPKNLHFTTNVEDTSISSEPLIKHFPIMTLLCLDDEVIETKPIIEIDVMSNDSHSQFIGTKIIFGSRTAQSSRETGSKKHKHDAEMQKCLNVKVLIEDISEMLKNSKAFCFNCKTLLPNAKAYNKHDRAVHSYQQVDKRDDNETDQRSGNSLFDGNKFKCDICQYSFTRLHNLRRHNISKHQFEMPQELVSGYKTSKLPKTKTLQEINKMLIEHNVNNTATTSDKTNNIRKKPPRSRKNTNFCNLCSNTATTSDNTNNVRKKPPRSRKKVNLCNPCVNTATTSDKTKNIRKKLARSINKVNFCNLCSNTATTSDKTNNIRKKPPRSRKNTNFCNLCSNTATTSDKTNNIRKKPPRSKNKVNFHNPCVNTATTSDKTKNIRKKLARSINKVNFCNLCSDTATTSDKTNNIRKKPPRYKNKVNFHNPCVNTSTSDKTKNIRKKPPRSRIKVNFCNPCSNTATTSDKTNNIKKKPPTSKNKVNSCKHCNKFFSKKEELISHLYDMLKHKTFHCPECLHKFDDQEELDKHSFEHIEVGSEEIMDISMMKLIRKKGDD